MVNYAAFAPIVADVIDTLTYKPHGETAGSRAESKAQDKESSDHLAQDGEEAHQALVAREVDYTIQKLSKLFQIQEQQAAGSRSGGGEPETLDPPDVTSSEGSQEVPHSEANEYGQEAVSETDPDEEVQEKPAAFHSMQQLRTCLESPPTSHQQRGSKHDIGVGRNIRRWPNTVRSTSNLRGSAEHLRFKLKQKEIKMVIKDMTKLLLTPYQLMQIVALGDNTRDNEHLVGYKECISRVACYLHEQVDLEVVIENATILHGSPDSDTSHCSSIPCEGALKAACMEIFGVRDEKKLGVLSTDDFFSCMRELSEMLGFQLNDKVETTQLNVLADPNGSGRVNYLYFVHLLHPLLRFLQQERHLAAARDAMWRHDYKAHAHGDEEK